MSSIDITELTEYGPAYAEHKVNLKAARESGNELDVVKVEMAWEKRQRELIDIAYSRADASRRRETALTEAKARFPRAPEKAYENLADPDAILQTAEQIHTAAEEAIKAATESWGQPGQGTGGAPPPPRQDIEARKRELVPQIRRGKPGELENEEFRQLIFRDQIGSRFDFELPRR